MLKHLALIPLIIFLLACRKDPELPRNSAPSPCSFENEASLFPSPVQDNISFCLSLSLPDTVTIAVLNVSGVEVVKLLDSCLLGGSHLLDLDVSNLSSGLYFCQINMGNKEEILTMFKQ